MGIFDGMQAVFGTAFGGLYVDGELLRAKRTDATDGDITQTYPDSQPIKVQRDSLTQSQRNAAGDTYTNRDVRFLVLQIAPDGCVIDPAPTDDDRITAYGKTWIVSAVTSDPVNAYWAMRATPA